MSYVTTQDTPFEYIVQHLQLVGWPIIVWFAVRSVRFLTKVEDRALAVESSINKAVTNDLPHIESSLLAISKSMLSFDSTMSRLIDAIHYDTLRPKRNPRERQAIDPTMDLEG